MFKYRYNCDICKTGVTVTPLSESGLHAGRLSSKLTEAVCLLASHVTFEVASDLLKRILDVTICPSTIKEVSEKIGDQLFSEEKIETKTKTTPAALAKKINSPKAKFAKRTYVQIDGAMVNTVDKWKENKLGIVFNECDIKRSGEDEDARVTIKKKQLVTSLALGVEDFRQRMKLLLVKTTSLWSDQIVVISDGATWIANTVNELIPTATHILDWFHVTEALWRCAKKSFGENSDKVKPWVENFRKLIWHGEVEKALELILDEAKTSKKSTAFFELYTYFKSRIPQMQYAKFRKAGFYIGSGAIESANKYAIQDRLKKAGMKWSIRGANAIAYLRTQYISKNWDEIWATA